MLKLVSRLLVIGLIALGLFLFFGSQFFQNAGNAVINAINGSAVHGLAQVLPSTSGNPSELQVSLQGLAPNSPYDITLDQNQCGGPLLKDVGKVTTDASGNVTKTFTVPDVSQQAQQSLWVDVHQGPTMSSQSAACGQVQLNGTSRPQTNLSSSTSSSSSSTNSLTLSSNVPSGVSNSDSTPTSGQGNQNSNSTGLPNSGVAPGGSNSYDNYTFPRKY